MTFFAGPRVTQLSTISKKEQTAQGIGVRSPGDVVREVVPGVKCLADFGDTHCYVGRWAPGATVTDFTIKAGYVSRISIGYVID